MISLTMNGSKFNFYLEGVKTNIIGTSSLALVFFVISLSSFSAAS